MNSDDVTAMLSFNQDLLGGIEPAGTTIDLRVSAAGFFEAGGLGGSGQSAEPLPVERVAETLLQYFDRTKLHAILDHILGLRNAL